MTLFSPRVRNWLVGLGVTSLLACLLYPVFGPEAPLPPDHGAHAFSVSAVGHLPLIHLLEATGRPVFVRRARPAYDEHSDAVLVIAEPETHRLTARRWAEWTTSTHRIVVVLPKWMGTPKPERPEWVESLELVSLAYTQESLPPVFHGIKVIRPTLGPYEISGPTGLPPVTLVSSPQLFRRDSLPENASVVVGSDRGTLVALVELGEVEYWLVADPDIFSGHGIGTPEGAAFAVALLDRMRAPGRTVVFDSTVHGFEAQPGLWRELGRFPLAFVLAQALLVLGVVLWSAYGRFGRALEREGGIPRSSEFLIENTADFVGARPDFESSLHTYWEYRVRAVAAQWHAPEGMNLGNTVDWLGRLPRAQTSGFPELADEMSRSPNLRGPAALDLARRIYHWSENMIHGRE